MARLGRQLVADMLTPMDPIEKDVLRKIANKTENKLLLVGVNC